MINGEEESGTESSSTLPPDTELFKYMLENAEIDYEKALSPEISIGAVTFELENGIRVIFDESRTLIGIELPEV